MSQPDPAFEPGLLELSVTLAPATVLEFSDDLRGPDVEALRSFLAARLKELVGGMPEDTGPRWAAERLAALVDADCRDLADALVAWVEILTEGRKTEPGHVQVLRQDLLVSWNRLVTTASRFTEHPDYLPRWRLLSWTCVEHAELFQEVLGDEAGDTFGDEAHP